MGEKWIIGEPGGPSGPFYSVVTQSGFLIAKQIPGLAEASQIAAIPELLEKVRVAVQLAHVASDWNLSEVEINGEMVSIYSLINDFNDALARARGEVT